MNAPRTALVLALTLACSDSTGTDSLPLVFDILAVELQPTDQWSITFRIANPNSVTVWLPRCERVATGLQRWTGAEWITHPVEACLTIYDQSMLALAPNAEIDGTRSLIAQGRYRLVLHYSRSAGTPPDQVVRTPAFDVGSVATTRIISR